MSDEPVRIASESEVVRIVDNRRELEAQLAAANERAGEFERVARKVGRLEAEVRRLEQKLAAEKAHRVKVTDLLHAAEKDLGLEQAQNRQYRDELLEANDLLARRGRREAQADELEKERDELIELVNRGNISLGVATREIERLKSFEDKVLQLKELGVIT